MGIFGDNRAQAIQVGAVLIFAIIIIFLSTYQAFVVPNQNEEIEFNHNQQAQQQMTDLRSNVILMPGSSSTRATSVDLGVRYPSRALFVNPGPASGTLRTVGTEDSAFNLTLEHATAVDEEGETGDFWNGTTVTYNTGAIEYRPSYNLYQNAPRTVYEHSVLYNNFTREGVTQAVTGQSIIDGRQITLIALNGSMSESRVTTASVDFDPVSTRARTVSINNTGDPITISLATGMSEDEWQNATLEEELVKNGGYVQSIDVHSGGPSGFNILDITLQPNERYQLELAKVGVGTGATETSAVYLTDVEGTGTTVQEGSTKQLVVEPRDEFNVPQSDITIDGAATRGTLSSLSVNSNTEGQAVFQYEAPEDIDGQTSVTGQVNLTIDGNPGSGSFNGSKPENIVINVTVENTDGSGLGIGGGGGPYNISFDKGAINKTQGFSCTPGCVYDLADDPDGEFNLTAVTTPTVVGAEVDFALNTTANGDFTSTSDTETDTNGEAKGVFDVTETGGIEAYVTSGGSGDTIEINITDSGTTPLFSAIEPDPERDGVDSDDDGEFVRVNFPVDEDTTGWVINDDEDDTTDLPSKTLQGEVYFAKNKSAFRETWGIDSNDVYSLETALSNSGDALFLNDSKGNIIDQVAYDGPKTTNNWTLSQLDSKGEVGVRRKPDGYIDTDAASDWRVESESDFFGEFTVSIDSVTNPVTEGEDVDVTATITNTGEVERTQIIDLNVDPEQDGSFITSNSTSLTLDGGSSQQVTLSYTTQTGDAPEIDLRVASEDNESPTEMVTVNEPAFFNVTLDSVNSSVSPGDEVIVDYTINNTGDVQGTQDITFEVNGTQEDTNSGVSLGSGESTSGRFRYTTGSGDTPQITVNVSSDNDSASETVDVQSSGSLTDLRITDIVPNASGQMQIINFTIAGSGLPAGEKVVIELSPALADARYDQNGDVRDVIDEGVGGGSEWNPDAAYPTLNYTAPDDSSVPVGTSVSFRLIDIKPDGPAGPFILPINRTDTASEQQARFSIAQQNGTAELQNLEVTDLVGTSTQDQKIRFTPTTNMVATGNGGEILTIDLSTAQLQGIDYRNTNGVTVTNGSGSASINETNGRERVQYVTPDTGLAAGNEIELTVQDVDSSSTGGTYQVGFSRGAADTAATAFDVTGQGLDFVEFRNVGSELVFRIENAGSTDVTIEKFEVDGTDIDAGLILDDGGTDASELEIRRTSVQNGVATRTGSYAADGTRYDLETDSDGGNGQYATLAPEDDEVDVDLRTFRDSNGNEFDLGQLTYVESGSDADLTVTLVLADGSEESFYFERETPSFDVSIDSIDTEVVEGENVTATVTVENSGVGDGTQTIEFRDFDGNVVDSREVSLDDGDSTSFELVWETESGDAGTGDVTIASETDSATREVTVNEPPNFEVTNFQAPSSAPRGTTITVNATVNNTGDLEGTQSIAYQFDGTTQKTTDVTLSPNQETTVEFTYQIPAEQTTGDYTHGIHSSNESATSTITVRESMADNIILGTVETWPGDNSDLKIDLENTATSLDVILDGLAVNDTTQSATHVRFDDDVGPYSSTTDYTFRDNKTTGTGYYDPRIDITNAVPETDTAVTLNQSSTIVASSTLTYALGQFRDSVGDPVNMVNEDVTVTLYFQDGSEKQLTLSGSASGGGQGRPWLNGDSPTVKTQSASNVGSTSATLNGELTDMANFNEVNVFFEYREQGTSTWTQTATQTLTSTQTFDEDISGLSDGTTYEFRANSKENSSAGSIQTFTAGQAPSTLTGVSASDLTRGSSSDSQTLQFTLDGDLASGETVDIDLSDAQGVQTTGQGDEPKPVDYQSATASTSSPEGTATFSTQTDNSAVVTFTASSTISDGTTITVTVNGIEVQNGNESNLQAVFTRNDSGNTQTTMFDLV